MLDVGSSLNWGPLLGPKMARHPYKKDPPKGIRIVAFRVWGTILPSCEAQAVGTRNQPKRLLGFSLGFASRWLYHYHWNHGTVFDFAWTL